MRIIALSNRQAVSRLIDRRQETDPAIARRVARIVAAVRRSGDPAVLRYARRFDQLTAPAEVSRDEIQAGLHAIDPSLRAALRTSDALRVGRSREPGAPRSCLALRLSNA
jgi:histidinol dehydrogenase